MSDTVTSTQVARHFADYLNRVAYRRESFLVVRGNRALAELRPLPFGKRLGDLPSLVASLPPLSPDEAGEFMRDLAQARESAGLVEVRDPWES